MSTTRTANQISGCSTSPRLIAWTADECEKICAALAALVGTPPRVEIYLESFSTSKIVQESVHELFLAILNFWTKACKFYRWRRLWNFLRSTWNDYELEFARLEKAMMVTLEQVDKGALAEHIGA